MDCDTTVFSGHALRRMFERAIHVVVAEDPDARTCYVVTAYDPDPALWEPDFSSRKQP